MAHELEIKVLNINVTQIIEKLSSINAEFVCDSMQRIYTYDMVDISSEYQSILFDIIQNRCEKSVIHALKRLKQLFFDLDDLIKENNLDSEICFIKSLFGCESLYQYVSNIQGVDTCIIEKLNNVDFIKIVNRYGINPNKWIRLRESNGKTTLTIKHILGRTTDENGVRHHDANNVLEFETTVGSIDTTKQLLELLGYYHKNYQEKRRIQYTYNGLEIDIDFWPHIPPYMEIEGSSLERIEEFAILLGLDKKDFCSLNTDDVYTSYGLDMYSYKELKFDK